MIGPGSDNKKGNRGTVAIMLHFVWKLWDKSATGVIKVEAIQLVWGPVIYPLFPCQLSSSSLSLVIFIDRRREPRQKKSLQRRRRGPGLFYLCLNPIQVRYFHFHELRYESSTLILYKELSSPIFQSCQWGMRDTLPNLHFLQFIKAWMSSTDPVSSITNCYCLIVSYTDPVHIFIYS